MKIQLSLITIFMLAASAGVNSTELTPDQCAEYKKYNVVGLSETQKKNLESSCKSRYTNENGVSNCKYFEAEKIKEQLNISAKTVCK